jgi:MoxR-like ATPase
VPAVILLDEITYGQSSHISGPLNEIVHPQCSYTVPRTGERIDFNNGHLFMGADNTNGSGDPTEMFVGTNVMNRATVDRFAVFRRFTYLPPAKEQALLQDKAQCSREIAMLGWGVLDALRKKVDSDLLADPPSLREAMAFCCALRAGFDQKDAFESCFVSKYMDDEQEEMRVTFTAFIEGK